MSTDKPMRYCKDCTHFMPAEPEGAPRCRRFGKEVRGAENPVYGPRIHLAAPDCVAARGEGGQCGPSGRSFKARPGSVPWAVEQHEKDEEVRIVKATPSVRRPWWKFWRDHGSHA